MKSYLKERTPGPIWNRLKQICRRAIASFRFFVETLGFSIARRSDYYSPLPTVQDLKKTRRRWHRPSKLAGIDVDVGAYKETLLSLTRQYEAEFLQLASYQENLKAGFGVGYNEIDAYVLYAMIRSLKPARYVEIGSGISTLYASLAGRRNGPDQHLEITCIEPHPYSKLSSIPDSQIIAKPVQDVDLSLFEQLSSHDVLFVDSSHVVRIDGDVPYIYLEILPSLSPGVVIHIHDMPFPYNVPHPPKQWVFAAEPDSLFWPVFWNEAMLAQAFLCGNRDFEIVLSLPLIRHTDESFLRETIPFYQDIEEQPNTFSSIWIRKCGCAQAPSH